MSQILLPDLFQDHMMLQRDKPLHIWGKAPEAAHITVRLDDTAVSCPVSDGRFSCLLPAQSAGQEKTLLFFTDREAEPALSLSHIAIGDIWMACGQSNMEYFLRYDAHWQDTKKGPRNSEIHMYNCPRIAYEGQVRDQPECGYWFGEDDPAWPLFSAPGYSFARNLQPELNVPVGVIGCNWGGTPACAWMDEAHLSVPPLTVFEQEYRNELSGVSMAELEEISRKAWAFEDSYRHQLEWRAMMYGMTEEEQQLWEKEHREDPVLPMGPWHHYRPAGLYHTMIRSIAPFTIKGFLWYQGESDSGHADIYDRTVTALIDCFRKTWQDETLPFLFVQLAPFGKWLECTGEHYAVVRDRQEKVSKTVLGAAMISIMDLGMYEDIHPKHKMEVGRRLALLARGKVYGSPILCESPEIASASRDGQTVKLTFLHTGDGLRADEQGAESFRISQSKVPLTVSAFSVRGDSVLLTLERQAPGSPADPSADGPDDTLDISYAQEDYCQVHIWNSAGLPVKPFRIRCDCAALLL